MANVRNDEIIVQLQHENLVMPLRDIDAVHPEVELDLANEVEPENPQP